MSSKLFLAAVAAAAVLPITSAGAATIFSDDFNSITSSALNSVPAGWVIEGAGTVDVIASGGFGIQCAGGSGGCVDLDGSTSNAGRLRTADPILLLPGTLYTLSAEVSGNQRGGAADGFSFGFLVVDGLVEIELGSASGIVPSEPFATFSATFQDTQSFAAYIYFDALGGDNVGPILDNVLLVTGDDGGPPSSVPEPGPLVLLLSSLAAAFLLSRRAPVRVGIRRR